MKRATGVYLFRLFLIQYIQKGARWRSGRASDSESRGPGFDPHKRHSVVSLGKTHLTA